MKYPSKRGKTVELFSGEERSQGTKRPELANKEATSTDRIKVLFPLMFGAVRRSIWFKGTLLEIPPI